LAERQIDELDDPEELGGNDPEKDDLEDDELDDEAVAVLGEKGPDGGEGLAKRSAKRGSDDSEEDIMSLVGQERDEPVAEPLPIRAQPIRDRQEFVCSRCRLVKPKVQLADAARGLCRDCV
jgi:hypothetical protein